MIFTGKFLDIASQIYRVTIQRNDLFRPSEYYEIYREISSPRRLRILPMISPILAFGVEAPAVIPIVSGPSGSQLSEVTGSDAPGGR